MKTHTIVQTIGLSIVMSLTSVSMAATQNNRSRSSDREQKSTVNYKIDNNRQRTATKTPTTVYEPRQASRSAVESRSSQPSRAKASNEKPKATKTVVKVINKSAKYKTGGYHTTYNYDYNKRPVVINHAPHYGLKPAHRQPHLVVNLPKGFFGLTLDGVRYYHNDGFFYRHHPQLGYVRVEMPKYFSHIPVGAVRILIEGRVYYKYHNLIFKHTAFGFKLA